MVKGRIGGRLHHSLMPFKSNRVHFVGPPIPSVPKFAGVLHAFKDRPTQTPKKGAHLARHAAADVHGGKGGKFELERNYGFSVEGSILLKLLKSITLKPTSGKVDTRSGTGPSF